MQIQSGFIEGSRVGILEHRAAAGIGSRFKGRNHASVRIKAVQRLERFLNRRGMVGKVIDDQDAIGFSHNVLSPLDPLESQQGFLKLLPIQPDKRGNGHCRQRVPEIVPTREPGNNLFLSAGKRVPAPEADGPGQVVDLDEAPVGLVRSAVSEDFAPALPAQGKTMRIIGIHHQMSSRRDELYKIFKRLEDGLEVAEDIGMIVFNTRDHPELGHDNEETSDPCQKRRYRTHPLQ